MTLDPDEIKLLLEGTQFNQVYRDIESVIGLEKLDSLAQDAEYFPDFKKSNNEFNTYVLNEFLSKILYYNIEIYEATINSVFSVEQLKNTEYSVKQLQNEILNDCNKYMMNNGLPKDTKPFILEGFNLVNKDILNQYFNQNRILKKLNYLAGAKEKEISNLNLDVEECKDIFSWKNHELSSKSDIQSCFDLIKTKLSNTENSLRN